MIDLVSKRYVYLMASLLIIIPGLIAVLLGGLKPGIDFTGGVRLTLVPTNQSAANATANVDQFKNSLAKAGYADAVVRSGTIGTGAPVTQTVTLDIPHIAQLAFEQREEKRSDIAKQLISDGLVSGRQISTTLGITDTTTIGQTASGTVTGTASITATVPLTSSVSVTNTGTTTGTTGTTAGSATAPPAQTVARWRVDQNSVVDDYTVGPTVGTELIGRAFLAILAASTAILLYLTVVFRKVPNAFRYGVCAIVALLHDVLVVLGAFAILGFAFGIEVDALFITAMLTVIGFSVHDTIVVFDRVRENIMRRRFDRFDEVVNYSLVQTLARSINTSITVLLTLFALYLFGGASVRNFVLALLIGILSGTYSSIFNASMLLVVWENREWNRGKTQPPATSRRSAATR